MIAASLEVAEADTAWLEEVSLRTRPMQDLVSLRAQDDAVGRLVCTINALAEAPTPQASASKDATAAPQG